MEINRISKSVVSKLPLFVKKDYPRFVQFLEDYYKSLEVDGSPLNFISKFNKFIDIDSTDEEFIKYFVKTFIPELPITVVDQRTLIKHIREHYRAKGSEHSIKFLFRILFDEDVDIVYPYYDILNVSDGKWIVNRSIKVERTSVVSYDKLVGCEAVGLISDARGIVESLIEGQSSTGTLFVEVVLKEFDVTRPLSSFIIGENVEIVSYDESAVLNEKILSVCSGVEITEGGKYYQEGDNISIISSTGSSASAHVKDVYPGSVKKIDIISGGTGYDISKCVVTISTNAVNRGRDAVAIVTGVDDTGAITEVTLIESGNGYTALPSVNISENDGIGSGCVLIATSDNIGKIKNVRMYNTGVGYENETALTCHGVPVTVSGVQVTCSPQVGSAIFTKNLLLYNKSGLFRTGEIVNGSVSGARGLIRRIDSYNNIISVEEIEGQFCIYDTLTGETTSETANVFDIGASSGTILINGISDAEGYFQDNKGQLSSDKYIQDSYYYQKYSYVITTTRKTVEWKNTLYNTVHPAGTIVFSYDDIFVPILETEFWGSMSPTLEMFNFYTRQPFSTNVYDKVYIKQFKDYEISELDPDNITSTGFCPGCELSIIPPS